MVAHCGTMTSAFGFTSHGCPDGISGPNPLRIDRRFFPEPASEVEGVSFQAINLYMDFPTNVTALRQTPCADDCCATNPIMKEEHLAPKLPTSSLADGLSLCKTHREIYQTLRTNQACSFMRCLMLGVSGTDGGNYCSGRMGQAAIPPAEGPRVKFYSDPSHHKAPANGMEKHTR